MVLGRDEVNAAEGSYGFTVDSVPGEVLTMGVMGVFPGFGLGEFIVGDKDWEDRLVGGMGVVF